MYFGSKAGFSPVPVVLGLILGTMTEEKFLLGNLIGNAKGSSFQHFTSGTINIVLISLCIASIVYGVYSSRKSKKN
jgi:putative tricarboxylic transport membrane protein